jgi:hypothetical protein
MEKEQVGIRCAKLYLDWSAAELAAKKLKEALVILKKVRSIYKRFTPKKCHFNVMSPNFVFRGRQLMPYLASS